MKGVEFFIGEWFGGGHGNGGGDELRNGQNVCGSPGDEKMRNGRDWRGSDGDETDESLYGATGVFFGGDVVAGGDGRRGLGGCGGGGRMDTRAVAV